MFIPIFAPTFFKVSLITFQRSLSLGLRGGSFFPNYQ